MQQHLMQMQPMMAAYYPNNITTDHIQQFLDENKSLILKIVESQNTGKLTECAENQARLQRNLMYLAAIADSQPQPPTVHAQYSSTGILQPGANYLQHQQAQQMSQQSLMAARSSLLYAQHPYTPMQQQQLHGQLGMSSGGSSIDLQLMHSEAASSAGCGGGLVLGGFPDFGHGKDAGSSEGRGGSSGCQNGNGSENHYLKAVKDPN